MQIVSITWARNEEDILESFVRHNAAIVDLMLIVLHCSTDKSLKILQSLQKEGLPITIRESDALYHAQSEVLTGLMHEVATIYNPNWILPLDADEFLSSSQKISDALRSTPTDMVSLFPWKTYIPTPEDHQYESDIRLRMTSRRREEPSQYYKVLIPRLLAMQSTIPLGSHILINSTTQIPLPTVIHTSLWLAHFPIRSERQLRQKIIQGWEAHSKNPHKKVGQNFHWELLYERCKDNTPMSDEELHTIAMRYALKPEDADVAYIEDPLLCL